MLKLFRDTEKNAVQKMLISRDITICSLVFCTSKTGGDIVNIVANTVMHIPNKGLGVRCHLGKTLRTGKGHMLGLECNCQFLEVKRFYASCEVENSVMEADILGVGF